MATPPLAPPPCSEDYKWKLSKKDDGATRSRRSTSSSFNNLKTSPSSSSSSPSTHRRCAFTRKCAALVKEQRARFYIMRRCVIMLICWRDYNDS
nr:uncharacterized protein LOC111905797 [Ipomoea trifida]